MTKTNKEDTELYIVVNKHTLTENSMTRSVQDVSGIPWGLAISMIYY